MPDRSRKQGSAPAKPAKDPLAAELGRRGGMKGGRARAERLPPELRRAIAQRAAAMRWAKSRAAASEPPRLPGTPTAAWLGTLTLAGRPLQVVRLEGGAQLVGQLSIEAALGEAVPAELPALTFHVPGDWQLKRGLRLEFVLDHLAARAAAGNAAALAMLAACAAPGLALLIENAGQGEPAQAPPGGAGAGAG